MPHVGLQANLAEFLAIHAHQSGQDPEPGRLLPVYLRPSEAEYAKLDNQKTRQSR